MDSQNVVTLVVEQHLTIICQRYNNFKGTQAHKLASQTLNFK